MVPLIVSKVRIVSLNGARLLFAALFGLAWLTEMVCGGWTYDLYPDFSVRVYLYRQAMPLLSILALTAFVELGARGLDATRFKNAEQPA